jgi:lipopolysaccharide/colanic/teichoic acid biosynthesis glycosyltransferase
MDAFYAENWTLLGDLRILTRTIPVVLGSRGAY